MKSVSPKHTCGATFFTACASAVYIAAVAPAFSSEEPDVATHGHVSANHDDSYKPHAPSGHGYHKNVLGAFVGVTHAGRRENAPAFGIEYSRRFSEHLSVGGVVEYSGDDADLWVAAIPFGWHLNHLKLYIAPGIEDGHHGTEELVRLGAEYAFELSAGWEVAPQINVDLVDGEDVWVFGLVFAKGF